MRMDLRAMGGPMVAATLLFATAARAESPRIRDNLFLLEEAYNQEPGVIQHVQIFQMDPRSKSWNWSFTEEWPVPTDLHQLSITLPASDAGGSSGIGDLQLSYRLQALGMGGKGRLAIAPRVSLVLPTGDWRTGGGRGALGVQLNLPVSIELGEKFVTHLNAGTTWTPAARSPGGAVGDALDLNAGAALVWQPLSWLNPLVELAWLSTEEVLDDKTTPRETSFTVSPGVRTAINFASGLQIVPGVAAPIQMVGGKAEVSVLGYLSFEHPAFDAPGAR